MAKHKTFDVFISHASEDKEAIAEPIANGLRKFGLEVWFDKFELKIGDSLRETIERGLAKSRFGVVIFSPAFFKKKWPKQELNGLFSREITGRRNRILPILHDISIGEFTKRYPIQADRLCLSSAQPIEELCKELVRVVKPQLSHMEGLKNRAFEVSDAFVEAARKQHPGYDFTVSTNVSSSDHETGQRKVEIRMVDPTIATPPRINITFVGDGARKAEEFIRTGKPQRWKTGEFESVRSSAPLFSEMREGEITVGGVTEAQSRPVSVSCGTATVRYMSMTMVRRGTDEGEFHISAENEPMSITFVYPFSPKKKTYGLSVKWKLLGFTARRLQTLLQFLEGVEAGHEIVITDLKGDIPEIKFPLTSSKRIKNPFSKGDRKIINLCAQIEEKFGVKLCIPVERTPQDRETLVILNSLLNNETVSVQVSGKYALQKGANREADNAICDSVGVVYSMFSPVQSFSGILPLFGVPIPVPLWGVSAECKPDLTEADRKAYCAALDGVVQEVTLTNEGVGRYRWASEFHQGMQN